MPYLLVQYGLAVIFVWAFAVQAGLPVPAVPMLLGTGALSGSGHMNLALAVSAAMIATVSADALWYAVGRSLGARVPGIVYRLFLDPDSVIRSAKERFLGHRVRYVVLAMFLPSADGVGASEARRSRGGSLGPLTSRGRIAAASLVILGWVAVASAEDTPKAPAGTRSLADTPFQLVLPSEHLLGDWFGARAWLEEHGVTPTVTFVTDALGNPTGGMRQGFRGASNLGLDLLFDLEKIFGLRGASFEISFSARTGSSLSQEDIGNLFSVQQVFGGETYRLVDVAYRQQLLGDRVEFRVGRIAAGDDFLVSPYNYVFVQNGFDGNPVGVFFNAPGMTAYPNATWGGLIKVRPTERTYVMAGLYNGDPSIRDNDHHGADWSMAGPLFAMAEVAYQVNGRPGDRGLIGNYKAGFWYDDSQYTDFNTVARGVTPQVSRGNWGLYGLFDQVLVQFGGPGSNRGFGITGSVLVSPDRSISQMPFFSTAGFLVRGLFPSRPTDVGGFGVVYGHFSNDLQDSQRRAAVSVQRYEMALELTYRLRFRDNAVFFQPDLQYIIRPGGTGQIRDAFVAGFQTGINF